MTTATRKESSGGNLFRRQSVRLMGMMAALNGLRADLGTDIDEYDGGWVSHNMYDTSSASTIGASSFNGSEG